MKLYHKFMIFALAISIIIIPSGCASASGGEERIKEILPAFEKYAQDSMKELEVPGMAIGIVYGDKLVYAKGFGVRKVGGTDSVTPATIFQIGSCSKAFASALLAMQVDQGKLKWDDQIIDYLPEFRMYDPWVTREFTVTDMLCHRSGLPHHFGDILMEIDYNKSQLINALSHEKPVTSFRTTFAYQNIEYMAAGDLTERITGKPWGEAVRDDLFLPLGMKNSSTDLESFKNGNNVAYLHQKVNGTLEAIPMDWKYLDWTYNAGPSGAINSNIYDMAKWLAMLMNNGTFYGKEIISEGNTRYMLTPEVVVTNPGIKANYAPMPFDYYCLGWRYGEYHPEPLIWHTGGTSGHLTIIAFAPQSKVGILVFANNFEVVPTILAKKFMDMYFENPSPDYLEEQKAREEAAASSNDSQTASEAQPSAPLPYESYAGNYTSDVFGNLRVFEDNGSLTMALGPKNTEIILMPYNRDTFLLHTIPDIPKYTDFGFVTFQIGPDGSAEGLTTETGGLLDGNFKKI